jgi:hypothetical protein
MKHIALILVLLLIYSCGEGKVSIGPENYESKIVVDGFIYPEQPVQNIRITRNIPVATAVNRQSLVITDALVTLTDMATNRAYDLAFSSENYSYEYSGHDLLIDYGNAYRIDIDADIDGQNYWTRATTRVPQKGFEILDSLCRDTLRYYERDGNGRVLKPTIVFRRSPDTDFYAFSIIALQASVESFIYPPTNVYIPHTIEKSDVEENLTSLLYSRDEIFNTPTSEGITVKEIEYFHVMFYGWYRVVAYAGDKNFKDYYLTKNSVQEIDGNLHEPVFHLEGDGIGVFGSAIADTLYFKILKE